MKQPAQCQHTRGFYQFEGDTFCRDCGIVEELATTTKMNTDELKLESSPLNEQVGGEHYKKHAIQPVEFIELNSMPFCMGNVIKYVVRHDTKGGAKDLLKAAHYCRLGFELHARKKAVGCNEPWVITPDEFIDTNKFDGLRATIILTVCGVYQHGAFKYMKAADLIGELLECRYNQNAADRQKRATPKVCPCCMNETPQVEGTCIGDFIVKCRCGRTSNPVNCESEQLAVQRWNSDFLWGDDFED